MKLQLPKMSIKKLSIAIGALLAFLIVAFAVLYSNNYNVIKHDYEIIQQNLTNPDFQITDIPTEDQKPNFAKSAWSLSLAQIGSKFRSATPAVITEKLHPQPPTDPLPQDTSLRSIAKLAPFSNDYMIVMYYPSDQSVRVTITSSPFSENKQKAIKFFTDHQVKNLCAMKLEFDAERDVREKGSLTQEERSTPGCPLLPQT